MSDLLKPAQGMMAEQLNELLGRFSVVAQKELDEIKRSTENLKNVVRLMEIPDKPKSACTECPE